MNGNKMTIKEYLLLKRNDPRRIEYNNELVATYPWLKMCNVWTGEELKDNTYTWLDDMPDGWRIAFGMDMVKEIDDLLKKHNCVNEYQITQIKEKYGTLRWYDFGGPPGLLEIILKYEKKSAEVCIYCGKPAIGHTEGWIEYLCEDCMVETCARETGMAYNFLEED